MHTTMTNTGFYLYREQDYSTMLDRTEQYRGINDLHALKLETITLDGERYVLYKMTTQLIDALMMATAAARIDGFFVKNRFTGATGLNPQMPYLIYSAFERHFGIDNA